MFPNAKNTKNVHHSINPPLIAVIFYSLSKAEFHLRIPLSSRARTRLHNLPQIRIGKTKSGKNIVRGSARNWHGNWQRRIEREKGAESYGIGAARRHKACHR